LDVQLDATLIVPRIQSITAGKAHNPCFFAPVTAFCFQTPLEIRPCWFFRAWKAKWRAYKRNLYPSSPSF